MGGIVGIIFGLYTLKNLELAKRVTSKSSILMRIQLFVIFISLIILYSTSASLERRDGLPLINQVASWAIISKF
jgi:phosphatidylinositol glycan class N